MKTVVRSEIKRFCSWTSVKGIARFVKADGFHLKCVWFLGTVTLITLSVVAVVQTLIGYFGYPQVWCTNSKLI